MFNRMEYSVVHPAEYTKMPSPPNLLTPASGYPSLHGTLFRRGRGSRSQALGDGPHTREIADITLFNRMKYSVVHPVKD